MLAPTTIDAFPAEVIEALRKYGASHPGAIISALSSEPGDWLVSESAVAEMLLECHPRSVRRMVLREELPPPRSFGRRRMWRLAEIRAHLLGIGGR